MDVAGQEQPARLGDGGHQLELGQVGAVVFTVAEWHQAILGDGVIATTGGGVESDPLDGQGIDVAVGVPEVGFQGLTMVYVDLLRSLRIANPPGPP